MRLISATVRNYRVHRELSVEFDPSRTLIGGPNESGKSTLIEAVHRALFLKATITGEVKASMQSTSFPGNPEVEVVFETDGAQYQLAKRFSGQSGTTRLTRVGGETWQGDEAQARLASLLGVNEPASGRATSGWLTQQWSHLWVWQGQSGKDPSGSFAPHQADLLQQLQRVGGAVAMQSELDGRVAARFSQFRGQIFTQAGAPKAGSDLNTAQVRLQQAEVDRTKAAERVEALRQTTKAYEAAVAAIARTAADLEDIGEQRRTVGERLTQLEALRSQEKTQVSAVDTAKQELTSLEGIEEGIAGLRAAITTAQEALGPMEREQQTLESRVTECRDQDGQAEKAYEQALQRTRDVRLRKELAVAHVDLLQRADRCQELGTRLEHVGTLQAEFDALRGLVAQLVPLDAAGLEAIQSLDRRLTEASAALNAMATEVEVVATDRTVRVGNTEVPAGIGHTVSDPTDIMVGNSVHLRIRPGGGESLAEAREAVRTLGEELTRSLDALALESVAQATDMHARRVDLQSQADRVAAALEEWDPEGLSETCRVAEAESEAAIADVRRRMGQVAEPEHPSNLAEARAWFGREETALASLESGEIGFKAARNSLRQKLDDLERDVRGASTAIGLEKQELIKLTAQLDLLVQNHGADELRARALLEARTAKDEAETRLAETRIAITALQPDLLEADSDRLQRAWSETEDQSRQAYTDRAVAQERLRSDGSDDPVTALSRAETELESATEHFDAVSRKARAIAHVDALFQQEQRALADQFSQPLAQAIGGYLQCLFGPEAQAVVSFADNSFKSIKLARAADGGAFSFDRLSGGTQEQMAAAVRLAIAELLAADHNGSLPVVFDDAFAYSDPERVCTLQRMLDRGASRGLQVIIVTCNPSDYASLGARQTTL